MIKLLFALALIVHGCFALAVQHYAPSSWLVNVVLKKKLAALHQLFPVALYPAQPSTAGGYLLATGQVVAGFLILKSLARL